MGIAKKIAVGGGLTIASVLILAYVAKKTNILDLVKQGVGSLGTTIGSSIGLGVANIPAGIASGFGESFTQSGSADPLGLKKAWNDFLMNFGLQAQGGGIVGSIGPATPATAAGVPQVGAGGSGGGGFDLGGYLAGLFGGNAKPAGAGAGGSLTPPAYGSPSPPPSAPPILTNRGTIWNVAVQASNQPAQSSVKSVQDLINPPAFQAGPSSYGPINYGANVQQNAVQQVSVGRAGSLSVQQALSANLGR